MENNENEIKDKEINIENNQENNNIENNQNENENNYNEKKNDDDEEKPEKKIPFLKDTNFDEIYLKINSIKQKHKEHNDEYNSNNQHFSLSNYKIDKIVSNNNLKELFEMMELKSNYNFYNSPYNSNNNNYNLKLSNTFTYPINTTKISGYKNSNNPTVSKIGSLFDDIDIINQKKTIPQNNIYLRKSFVNQKKLNNLDNNYDKKNDNIFSQTMPSSNYKKDLKFNDNEKLKSGKKSLFNSDFNNTFISSLKKNNNKWNDSINNKSNLWKSMNNFNNESDNKNSYEKFTKNVISWFNKYNKNYYKEEINNLNDRLDKAGDYKSKNRKNILKNKNNRSKFKYYYKK